jgi:2'-5' RNA ligase
MSGVLVRGFVAVLLPDPVRARLAAHVATLRSRAPRLAWVRAESLHLTLRFLGEVDAATVARAEAAVRGAARSLAPFTVALGGLGGFPSAGTARVVWAGVVEGSEPLRAVQRVLEDELAARGIPPEGRAFHPHVTLGRARDPRGARGLEALLGAAVGFGSFRVRALHLMRSELAREGARYSVLAEAPLEGAGSEEHHASPHHSSPVDIPRGSA